MTILPYFTFLWFVIILVWNLKSCSSENKYPVFLNHLPQTTSELIRNCKSSSKENFKKYVLRKRPYKWISTLNISIIPENRRFNLKKK